ncbi:DUF3426 domain-containing protein [Duganella sp. Leaf126]|uniref:DUF3426 domain-containing protein n=1 Tax=Duganella sp. Leaf126 TaxID=1736266 RepID=UPI001E2D0DCB|nr:DUF3426 domain-containing protein [Duganella sp. Leaf126]
MKPDTEAESVSFPEPAPLPEPPSASVPALPPDPALGPAPTAAPFTDAGAPQLLAGDTLSEAELQAAIEAELAALDARMAAAQPAPALTAAAAATVAPRGDARRGDARRGDARRGDARREPTLDDVAETRRPDELDEEDEQALLQLAAGRAAADDIPPSHTLLRTASAPPEDRYYGPEFHSTELLIAAPVAERHSLEPSMAAGTAAAGAHQGTDHDMDHSADQLTPPQADDEPGFVKRERHRERYGRTTTVALCIGIVLMVGALVAQGLTTFRNPLAAAMPSLKPALVAACKTLGCKVELPSQIDALAIEQGELQTLSENTFSFATALKNSSGTAQAWPHIELVLDDANDKTVLRRVFAPRDYLDPGVDIAQGFPARSEQPVKLYFELKQSRASGYHIAVFYP